MSMVFAVLTGLFQVSYTLKVTVAVRPKLLVKFFLNILKKKIHLIKDLRLHTRLISSMPKRGTILATKLEYNMPKFYHGLHSVDH